MKLKSLANFRMEDKKRGMMIERTIGEEFEMDEREEGEVIYTLLRDLRMTIIDEKFVPVSWRYTVIHAISYINENGERRDGILGREITLPQDLAVKFLVSGHVRPIDESGWTPQKLLQPTVKGTNPKKMFDDDQPKRNWIRDGRER